MNKKALVIVGLAGIVALSTGVITYIGTQNSRGSDKALVESTEQPAYAEYTDIDTTLTDVDPEDLPTDAEADTASEVEDKTEESTDAVNTDIHGYTNVISSAGTYRIRRVFDHTNGNEVTAREVFGQLYSYCSLSFDADGHFDLCISPTSGEIRRGSYKIFDDVISVTYDDGKGAEFGIITDTPGEIGFILVNYGDYDVYFGLK